MIQGWYAETSHMVAYSAKLSYKNMQTEIAQKWKIFHVPTFRQTY